MLCNVGSAEHDEAILQAILVSDKLNDRNNIAFGHQIGVQRHDFGALFEQVGLQRFARGERRIENSIFNTMPVQPSRQVKNTQRWVGLHNRLLFWVFVQKITVCKYHVSRTSGSRPAGAGNYRGINEHNAISFLPGVKKPGGFDFKNKSTLSKVIH